MSDRFVDTAALLAGMAGAVFGWRPDDFWAATPAELAVLVGAMLQPEGAASPPDRDTVFRLMEAFPDG